MIGPAPLSTQEALNVAAGAACICIERTIQKNRPFPAMDALADDEISAQRLLNNAVIQRSDADGFCTEFMGFLGSGTPDVPLRSLSPLMAPTVADAGQEAVYLHLLVKFHIQRRRNDYLDYPADIIRFSQILRVVNTACACRWMVLMATPAFIQLFVPVKEAMVGVIRALELARERGTHAEP